MYCGSVVIGPTSNQMPAVAGTLPSVSWPTQWPAVRNVSSAISEPVQRHSGWPSSS